MTSKDLGALRSLIKFLRVPKVSITQMDRSICLSVKLTGLCWTRAHGFHCVMHPQVPNKCPPLINFSIFFKIKTSLRPPLINFREIEFSTNPLFHFLSLLVLICTQYAREKHDSPYVLCFLTTCLCSFHRYIIVQSYFSNSDFFYQIKQLSKTV